MSSSDLGSFAYKVDNRSPYKYTNRNEKRESNKDDDWILQMLSSNESKALALSFYYQITRDALLALGDPLYIASLIGKNTEKESILTRNLQTEIDFIVGVLNSEPRSCEITINDQNNSGNSLEDMQESQDYINKSIAELKNSPFSEALKCMKERLIFGVSWMYIREENGKIIPKVISPLQVFEYPTTKNSTEENSYFILYEDYESLQFIQMHYDINAADISLYADNSLELIDHTTLLGDTSFKQFMCSGFINETNIKDSDEYIKVSIKDIGGEYKKKKIPQSFSGSLFVRHVFASYLEQDQIFDEENSVLLKSARVKCNHRVYIGNTLVKNEILDQLPLIRMGSKLIESTTASLYSYRGVAYKVAHLLLLYASTASKLCDSINNTVNKRLLVKNSLLKTGKNKSLKDVLSSSASGIVLFNDTKMDRNLSADILPMNFDIVDRSSIEALNNYDMSIRLGLGLMDSQKLADSALQEKYRIILQQTSLSVLANEMDAFLRQYTLVVCSLMNLSFDSNMYKVVISLDKYSDTFKSRELGKIITASRLVGGIPLPLSDVFDLLNINKDLADKIIQSVEQQQAGGEIDAKQKEADLIKTLAEADFKDASAEEKRAKAKLENKKASSPVVTIKGS
ncbi:MAG: hypothetical protein ACRCX2_22280 [Paraclostridium sp.]